MTAVPLERAAERFAEEASAFTDQKVIPGLRLTLSLRTRRAPSRAGPVLRGSW